MGRPLHVGAWNVNGLTDYKQGELLHCLQAHGLNVVAISETHLINEEECADWAKEVHAHHGFVWFGRSARQLQDLDRTGAGLGDALQLRTGRSISPSWTLPSSAGRGCAGGGGPRWKAGLAG